MTDNISAPPLRDLPPGHLEARKQHLFNEIARTPEKPRRSLPTFPLFERRRAWRPAAVVAFAVTATVVLLSVIGGSGSPGAPSSAAAGVFHRLAGRIAAQPLTPQPGQYLYLDFKSEWGAFEGNSRPSCETRSVEHRQIWIGTDGSGLDRATEEPGRFTSAADRATCLSVASSDEVQKAALQRTLAGWTSDDWNAPRCLELGPTSDWSSLSSNPQVLLQQILNLYHGDGATPAQQFSYIADILGRTDAPPDVRANIYRAAALIPGVQSLGTVQDHDGRPGLGLAITTSEGTPNATDELIFNPQTGELLGETATGPYGGWYVYLDTKVVNGLPSPPPAPLTPPCTSRGEGTVQDIPGGSITTGKGLSPQQ
jgi:hypothetical protein